MLNSSFIRFITFVAQNLDYGPGSGSAVFEKFFRRPIKTDTPQQAVPYDPSKGISFSYSTQLRPKPSPARPMFLVTRSWRGLVPFGHDRPN
jgi:hypothetical protein